MATLALVWNSLSFPALALGGLGIGLVAAAVLGLVALPTWMVRPLIGLGVTLVLAAGLYEAGFARATAAAAIRREHEIAEANRLRAEAAERALSDDSAQAKADATTIAALRKQIDATPRDPRACLPAAAARRVFQIR